MNTSTNPKGKVNIMGIDFCGIALNHGREGDSIKTLSRGFITSHEPLFEKIITLLANMVGLSNMDTVNKLLIVINSSNIASVYFDFSIFLTAMAKRSINCGDVVFEDDVFEINEVTFEYENEKVIIEKGDQVIWLFRSNWRFGLYLDLTKERPFEEISIDMGKAFSLLKFHDLYLFLEDSENFSMLINDGWFPFIELLGSRYKQLLEYYNSSELFDPIINNIIDTYDKTKILTLCEKWWSSRIYIDKKDILMAGIMAYLDNNSVGYINCIKNLSSELEGIMRIAFFNENNKKPKFHEFGTYIETRALSKYKSVTNTFPDLFKDYIDCVLFKSFDLGGNDIPLSRHSSSHGIAAADKYTKVRALQQIFCLDQLWYYLS